jgi:hypothetical protein
MTCEWVPPSFYGYRISVLTYYIYIYLFRVSPLTLPSSVCLFTITNVQADDDEWVPRAAAGGA